MPTRRTKNRKDRFLEAIARGLGTAAAAAHAGVDRSTPYKWEDQDPTFAQAMAEARSTRLQQLLDTTFDQAMEGQPALLRYLIDRYDRQTAKQTGAVVTEVEITVREESHGQPDAPAQFFVVEPK